MVADCPLIDVSGPPRERGRQHGAKAPDRIRRGIGLYKGRLQQTSFDWSGISGLIDDYLPVIEGFDPLYVEEMRGIAEGAGVPFEEIVMLNARTEILKLGQRPDLRRQLKAKGDDDGCTGLVVLPSATRDGRLIHAQNWDWMAECAETAIVLRIRRDDGPDILTFTEAGGLARSGLNAAGIAITANYLASNLDYARAGVPLALIRRKVLEQEYLALAWRAVYATPKSSANNMMVSHKEGMAIDFECAPDETFQVHPERGLLVHANHFVSPVALGKLKDLNVADTPDSLYRDLRVRDLLAPQVGSITPAAVKAALFDDFQTPWSVCRPPRRSLTSNLTATVAMIVMDPGAGSMDVCMVPAHNKAFITFSLGAAAPGARAAAE
jgi:isopenicillin-N N-acyltransferase like protein